MSSSSSLTVAVQTMTGEVLPFTLPEESEIADLKGQIANHYEVNLVRIVLSTKSHTPEEGDTFIVCKDYGEVESDATYYLFINSISLSTLPPPTDSSSRMGSFSFSTPLEKILPFMERINPVDTGIASIPLTNPMRFRFI